MLPRGCQPGGSAMTRRSRRRPVILVILASVVGALLAFIPRPSLSVVREMRAHTDTPLVSSASAPAAGPVAHKEGVAEFRMIGVTWTGTAQPDLKVRTLSHGTWSAWSDLGPTDNAPDPGTREASHAANSSEPFWVGKADGYQVQVPDGVTGVRVHLVRDTGPKIQLHASAPAAEASAPMPPIGSRAAWGARAPKQAPEYASTVSVAFVH